MATLYQRFHNVTNSFNEMLGLKASRTGWSHGWVSGAGVARRGAPCAVRSPDRPWDRPGAWAPGQGGGKCYRGHSGGRGRCYPSRSSHLTCSDGGSRLHPSHTVARCVSRYRRASWSLQRVSGTTARHTGHRKKRRARGRSGMGSILRRLMPPPVSLQRCTSSPQWGGQR